MTVFYLVLVDWGFREDVDIGLRYRSRCRFLYNFRLLWEYFMKTSNFKSSRTILNYREVECAVWDLNYLLTDPNNFRDKRQNISAPKGQSRQVLRYFNWYGSCSSTSLCRTGPICKPFFIFSSLINFEIFSNSR